MKNIVLVANTAWSIYNFRKGLLLELLKADYKVTILAPKDETFLCMEKMGCNVVHLPMSGKGVNPFSELFLLIQLWLFYLKIKPDFIIHYTIKPNIYGSIAASLLRIPSLAVTTGLGYTFVKNNLISKVAKYLYRYAFKKPNEVWFLNKDDLQVFLEKHLIKKEKAVLLDSEGVDVTYFSPMKYENRQGVVFLLVARMLWDKGVGEYVEAARKIKQEYKDVSFKLLGACDVENPSAISKKQILEWGQQGIIEYLGVTNDVRSYIANSDCVVLPSYYREGVPRVLMEAAAMAKPIITTNNVGCKEVVIQNITGLLCLIKSSDDLVNAFEEFLQMSVKQREDMGNAGRQYMIDRFDEQKTIKQYMLTIKKYL